MCVFVCSISSVHFSCTQLLLSHESAADIFGISFTQSDCVSHFSSHFKRRMIVAGGCLFCSSIAQSKVEKKKKLSSPNVQL